MDDGIGVPVCSPFLWFRVCPKKMSLKLPKINKLDVENGSHVLSNGTLMDNLYKCENVRLRTVYYEDDHSS